MKEENREKEDKKIEDKEENGKNVYGKEKKFGYSEVLRK